MAESEQVRFYTVVTGPTGKPLAFEFKETAEVSVRTEDLPGGPGGVDTNLLPTRRDRQGHIALNLAIETVEVEGFPTLKISGQTVDWERIHFNLDRREILYEHHVGGTNVQAKLVSDRYIAIRNIPSIQIEPPVLQVNRQITWLDEPDEEGVRGFYIEIIKQDPPLPGLDQFTFSPSTWRGQPIEICKAFVVWDSLGLYIASEEQGISATLPPEYFATQAAVDIPIIVDNEGKRTRGSIVWDNPTSLSSSE